MYAWVRNVAKCDTRPDPMINGMPVTCFFSLWLPYMIHQARANHYFRGAYLPPTNSGGCAFLAQPESGRVMAATVPKLKLAGGAFHGRDWSTVEAHLDLGEKLPLAGAQWLPASGQMQEHRQSLRSHGGSLYTAYIPRSLRIWAYGCWLS